MEDPSLLEIQDITPGGPSAPEGSQMFRAARSIRRRLPGPLRARRAPDVRGGAENPMGPPEALPHPKISRRLGRCGTPSGEGQHDEGSLGRPHPGAGVPGVPGGKRRMPGEGDPGRSGAMGPVRPRRVRGYEESFISMTEKIGVQWRHKALRPLKRI